MIVHRELKEREEVNGYAVGVDGIIKYICNELPVNEQLKGAFREEVKIYPEEAIRELVVNMLIHQDFSISGMGLMIEIFKNRIEFTNPGKPIIDILKFIGCTPKSRNERLARIMRRMNLCEQRGSGINKIVLQAEICQLPAPEFIEGDDFSKPFCTLRKTIAT